MATKFIIDASNQIKYDIDYNISTRVVRYFRIYDKVYYDRDGKIENPGWIQLLNEVNRELSLDLTPPEKF